MWPLGPLVHLHHAARQYHPTLSRACQCLTTGDASSLMNAWVLVGLALNVSMVLMFVVWLVCRRLNNAGFVDAAWSYGFALNASVFALIASGAPLRRILFATMVAIWSLRLGTHLLIRLMRRHPKEDARHAGLREQFPQRPWLMFFGFFQLQGVLLGFLCLPFAIASTNPSPFPNFLEVMGFILWAVALSGEALADHQLSRFQSNPATKGKACNTGLWRFSRHPNYFFEWLVWIAYFVFASGSPGGWVSVYCPLLMLYFLTKVTGIPPAEAQALKSRGDAYRQYQRSTGAFIPWPPKNV